MRCIRCWPNCWKCIRRRRRQFFSQTQNACFFSPRSASTSECFRMFYVLSAFSFIFALQKKCLYVRVVRLPLLQRASTRVHFYNTFFLLVFSRLFPCAIHFRLHRAGVVGGGHQKHNNREPSIEMYIHLGPFISVFQSSCEWFQFFSSFFFLFACVLASPVHFPLYGNAFVCA